MRLGNCIRICTSKVCQRCWTSMNHVTYGLYKVRHIWNAMLHLCESAQNWSLLTVSIIDLVIRLLDLCSQTGTIAQKYLLVISSFLFAVTYGLCKVRHSWNAMFYLFESAQTWSLLTVSITDMVIRLLDLCSQAR